MLRFPGSSVANCLSPDSEKQGRGGIYCWVLIISSRLARMWLQLPSIGARRILSESFSLLWEALWQLFLSLCCLVALELCVRLPDLWQLRCSFALLPAHQPILWDVWCSGHLALPWATTLHLALPPPLLFTWLRVPVTKLPLYSLSLPAPPESDSTQEKPRHIQRSVTLSKQ